jgi:hypothetical protein
VQILFSLLLSSKLVLVYSNVFYRPSLYCLKHFCAFRVEPDSPTSTAHSAPSPRHGRVPNRLIRDYFLSVHVDILEVLHLKHLDEPCEDVKVVID